MDWMRTNNSTQVNWSDRQKLTDSAWDKAPIEMMVALCNKLDADAWFCMPHLATNDYITQFATYVRNNLESGLTAYVEYSNEYWNPGFTGQNRYMIQQGKAIFTQANNYPNYTATDTDKGTDFFSMRTCQIADIWNSVFVGQTNRVDVVMATQAANDYTANRALACAWDRQTRTPNNRGIKSLAIAPYFGFYLGSPTYASTIRSWFSDSDGGIGKIIAELSTGGILPNGPQGGALVQSRGWIVANKAKADQYSVKLLAYEGQSHVSGIDIPTQNDTGITNLFINAHRDQRMGDLYARHLNDWFELVPTGLYNNYLSTRTPDKYGSWGVLENVGQTSSPRYNALLAALNETGSIPSISISSPTVTVSTTNSVNMNFVVTLSSASQDTVTVQYTTVNNTALTGRDYTGGSGIVTFNPNQVSQNVSITVLANPSYAPTRDFYLDLSSPTNSVISRVRGTGSILNTTPPPTVLPTLSINSVVVTEGDTGSVVAPFTVTLSSASVDTVSVDYQTVGGTASAEIDFITTAGTLTFQPSQLSQVVNVPIISNTVLEENKTFSLVLSNPVNATLGLSSRGDCVIVDNDQTPLISVSEATVTEGSAGNTNLSFEVGLSAAAPSNISFNLIASSLTARPYIDYVPVTDRFTIYAGQTSLTVQIPIVGDNIPEPTESFTVRLTNIVGARIGREQATITIIDNDDYNSGSTVIPPLVGSITLAQISNLSSLLIANTQVTGLGTAATLNVGVSPNNVVQLDSSGRLPAVDGSQLTNISNTQINGLGSLATVSNVTLSQISNLNTLSIANTQITGLGTASTFNVGTGASNLVQLDSSGRLPAVNASQLTNLSSSQISGLGSLATASSIVLSQISNLNSLSIANTQVTGLGTASTLNAGIGASNLVQLDSNSRLPAVNASQLTNLSSSQISGLGALATASSVTLSQISNLNTLSIANTQVTGLGSLATASSITLSQISNLNTLSIANTQVTGLGTASTLNVGTSANNIVQLDSNGRLPAVNASQLTNISASQISGLESLPQVANNTVLGNVSGNSAIPIALTSAQLSSLLGLGSLATASNITLSQISNLNTLSISSTQVSGLGTASTLNVGTSANNIVQLDSNGRLPAVNASQLTNISNTQVSGLGSLATASNITLSQISNLNTLSIANTQVTGLGSLATLSTVGLSNIASIANNTILGNVSGNSASPVAITVVQLNNLLGLGSLATASSVTLSQISNLNTLSIANTQVTGLGTASTLNVGTSANNIVQLDSSGRLPAVNASQLTNISASQISGLESLPQVANNTVLGNISGNTATPIALTSAQLSTLLGLGSLATASNITLSQISNLNTLSIANTQVTGLGTASTLNVGTSANNIVQLDSSSRLPAVNASQLTNISNTQISGLGSLATASNITLSQISNLNTLSIANTQVTGLGSLATASSITLSQISDLNSLSIANTQVSGLGSLATLSTVGLSNIASIANNTILGNVSGSSASPVALTSAQLSTLLGLGSLATASSITLSQISNLNTLSIANTQVTGLGSLATSSSVTLSQISNLNSLSIANTQVTGLGTASTLNVGTSANNLVQLDSSSRLPAVNASQLTNISNTQVSGLGSLATASSITLSQISNLNTLSIANTQVTGLGSLATLSTVGLSNIASIANNTVLGNVSGSSASPVALTSAQLSTLLGLGSLATASSITLSQISNLNTLSIANTQVTGLGTASTLNVGTSANNIVQLDSSSRLPAVDGSQLTGITASVTINNSRQTATITTASINAGATLNTTITLSTTCIILRVVASVNSWIRFYSSTASRASDAARLITTAPDPGSGIIFDISGTSFTFSPLAVAANFETSISNVFPLTIVNNGSTGTITLTITYIQIQA